MLISARKVAQMTPSIGGRHQKFHYDGWYQPPGQGVEPLAKDTTAIVLGWAGSRSKYVQIYTKLFADEFGMGAHGYILPMDLTFSYHQPAQRKLAQDCLEVMHRENTGRNIVIHCFSNNGFNFYKHVSQLLRSNPYELAGAIFDSCPGPLSLFPYAAQGLGFTSVHDTPLTFPFPALPGVYGYFQYTENKKSIPVAVMKGMKMLPTSFVNYFKYGGSEEWAGNYLMHKEDDKWPLLFLYSKKDPLMAYKYVSKVVEAKKIQNPSRLIRSRLFDKSDHVAHMRRYPNEYREEMRNFIRECLPTTSKL